MEAEVSIIAEEGTLEVEDSLVELPSHDLQDIDSRTLLASDKEREASASSVLSPYHPYRCCMF